MLPPLARDGMALWQRYDCCQGAHQRAKPGRVPALLSKPWKRIERRDCPLQTRQTDLRLQHILHTHLRHPHPILLHHNQHKTNKHPIFFKVLCSATVIYFNLSRWKKKLFMLPIHRLFTKSTACLSAAWGKALENLRYLNAYIVAVK